MYRILLIALLLAGCAPYPYPPVPPDIVARQFDAVPGKTVIFVVRTPMDSSQISSLALDDRDQITTFARSYYRWEVDPGPHRIAGVGPASEQITLSTVAGGVYFLEHTVRGTLRAGVQLTAIRQINEQAGRALVLRSYHL